MRTLTLVPGFNACLFQIIIGEWYPGVHVQLTDWYLPHCK